MDTPGTAPLSAEQLAAGGGPGAPVWIPGVGPAWTERSGGESSVVCESVAGGRRVVSGDAPPAGRATMDTIPDGRVVYPERTGRLVVVDVATSAASDPVALTPEGVRATAPSVAPDGEHVAYVAETQDSCVVAVTSLDGTGAEAAPVAVSSADFGFDPAWSPDGRHLVWHEWDVPAMPWDNSRIVSMLWPDGSASVVAGRVTGDVARSPQCVGQPRFSPDGGSLAYVGDAGGWMRVAVCAPDGSGRHHVSDAHVEHAEPTWGPGQRSHAWAPDSSVLAWCENHDGAGRLVVGAPGRNGSRVAAGWHRSLRWSEEGGLLAVRSAPSVAPHVVRYEDVLPVDSPARPVRPVVVASEPAAGGQSDPEPVSWEIGSDVAHGLLWWAAGTHDSPRPLLVNLHGGPTDQAVADWWPRAAFWCERGWNVLTPNGRGSTGYGRDYTQALTGRWGDLDVTEAIAALQAAGPAGWGDPGRLVVSGGSAGGFTALRVAAGAPGLVAAGVVRYPVTDLEALAAATHRFEAHYTDTLVGPLPDTAATYRERSPLHRVKGLASVPLLVFQGGDDPAVPQDQTDAFVEAARTSGADIDYEVYPDEAHGFSDPATIVDELTRTEAFLERHVLSSA